MITTERAIIGAALFAAPLLSLARPLWQALGLSLSWPNRVLGAIERRLSRLRQAGVILGVGLLLLLSDDPQRWLWAAVAGALLGLAALRRFEAETRAVEWLRRCTRVEPAEFFRAADAAFGPAGFAGDPQQGERPAEGYDFRRGIEPRPSFMAMAVAFFDMAWMARLVLRAEAILGRAYFRECFDPGGRLWGLTLLWHARARLETRGFDKLRGLAGKRIFLFNHVSMTDFVLGFPALDRFIDEPERVRLRFVIAKDHFIDNPLIYSVAGIGRCAEAGGMVAVDRKNSRRAVASMEEAAARFAGEDLDLAIYPQGTRARVQRDAEGRPIDAGFYSSARPAAARRPLGHIKKGAAFFVLDLLRALRGGETETPVHLVFVGVEGGGSTLPKKSLVLRLGGAIRYRIAEVLTLHPSDVVGVEKGGGPRGDTDARRFAEELTERIERALARACRIDERLAELYRTELGRDMPALPGLRRLFDQVLALKPEPRRGWIEALRALPSEATEDDLAPLWQRWEDEA